MGLLAVHLILQFVNEVNEGLSRKVTIYSDCLGARDKWNTYHHQEFRQGAHTQTS
jgi:hypothetical protein